MAALMPQGKQQFFTAGGIPLVGGKVYTYAAGTTTPLATYTTAAASTPNTNPVILDSRGEASIFFSAANYKIVVKDSLDSTIWTQDNLPGDAVATIVANLAASTGSSLVGYLPAGTGAVATTVQTKLRESVSVKDFGAVGDGTTDDTAALQAALTYAASVNGLSVFVPHGTYLCSGQISLSGTPTSISIIGEGRDSSNTGGSRIVYSGSATPFLSIPTLNSRFISFSDLDFSCTNAAFTGTLLRLNVYGPSVSRCRFGGAGSGLNADRFLDITESVDVSIDQCVFRYAFYPLYGSSCNAVSVTNCDLGLFGNYAVQFTSCQGVVFKACSFEQDVTGEKAGALYALTCTGVSFVGCWFGDVVTLAGSATSNWISWSGNGLSVSGCYINGDGYHKTSAIVVTATSRGINVTGNYFSSFVVCLNIGSSLASDVLFLANNPALCDANVSGTLLSGTQLTQTYVAGANNSAGSLTLTGNFVVPAMITTGALTTGFVTNNAATYTILTTDTSIMQINTASVYTLPHVSSFPGRVIKILNRFAGTITSASSNVVPITGGAAGTAILPATSGKWVTLQSDGNNWLTVAGN